MIGPWWRFLAEASELLDASLEYSETPGGNTIRFTDAGGRMPMRADCRASFVEFMVDDTGRGIASTDFPCIFDRYWQATEKPEGGGRLGLMIAKQIINAHGGDVRIASELGRGPLRSSGVHTAGAA